MGRKAISAVVAVLVAATLFVAGMLTERAFLKPTVGSGVVASGASQPLGHSSDRVGIRGQAVIAAYHADGTRFALWEGHNSLSGSTINGLVGCITGANTAPPAEGSCSGWITGILVQGNNSAGVAVQAQSSATNSLSPVGCSNPIVFCTGWKSTATIDTSIVTPFTIDTAAAGCGFAFGGPASTGCNVAFDVLSVVPQIPVQPGDRVIITITFTVS